MYSNCCGHSSFCCPPECYKFDNCCNMVNHTPACNPCYQPQAQLYNCVYPSCQNFSTMPQPLMTLTRTLSVPNTAMGSRNLTKKQKNTKSGLDKDDKTKQSDMQQKGKTKQLKGKEQAAEKHQGLKPYDKSSETKNFEHHKNSDITKDKASDNGIISRSLLLEYEEEIFSNHSRINKYTSSSVKKQTSFNRGNNAVSKDFERLLPKSEKFDSGQDFFDIITDNNVIVNSHVTDTSKAMPGNTPRRDVKSAANNKGCLRNPFDLKVDSYCSNANIKFNEPFPLYCNCCIDQENDRLRATATASDSVIANKKLKSNRNGYNSKGLSTPAKSSQIEGNANKKKSFKQYPQDSRMPVIAEESRECNDCKCDCASSTSPPMPLKHGREETTKSDYKDNDDNLDESKIIEESCTDFLNMINESILESVQNSLDGILQEFYEKTVSRMDELQTTMGRMDELINQLYYCFMEKLTEQNATSTQQFQTILQCLNSTDSNRTYTANNLRPTNSRDKECQCCLYIAVPPYAVDDIGNCRQRCCCAAASNESNPIPTGIRRTTQHNSNNKNSSDRNQGGAHISSTNEVASCKCCCCHVKSASNKQASNRNSFIGHTKTDNAKTQGYGRKRFVGGGCIAMPNYSLCGHTIRNDSSASHLRYSGRSKCCCGLIERNIMTSSICDKYRSSQESMDPLLCTNISSDNSSHSFEDDATISGDKISTQVLDAAAAEQVSQLGVDVIAADSSRTLVQGNNTCTLDCAEDDDRAVIGGRADKDLSNTEDIDDTAEGSCCTKIVAKENSCTNQQ